MQRLEAEREQTKAGCVWTGDTARGRARHAGGENLLSWKNGLVRAVCLAAARRRWLSVWRGRKGCVDRPGRPRGSVAEGVGRMRREVREVDLLEWPSSRKERERELR